MDLSRGVWENKKILITGHTGFKGTWLGFILKSLGANLIGLSLPESRSQSLYRDSNATINFMDELFFDICNKPQIDLLFVKHKFDYVFHLAAQSQVKQSFRDPLETFKTNIIGTANILSSALQSVSIFGIMIVTSDKVYQNLEMEVSFSESDRLGGDDPYSASKAAVELITHAFDSSLNPNGIPIVSVRAGNVIGGGDWSDERLVPDIVRAIATKSNLTLRSPKATRPWQHVLDCLGGYLLVAESQISRSEGYQTSAVNFGPLESMPVQDLVEIMISEFDYQPRIQIEESTIKEKNQLAISSELANTIYGWNPQMATDQAIKRTAQWYSMFLRGKSSRELVVLDIQSYFEFQE